MEYAENLVCSNELDENLYNPKKSEFDYITDIKTYYSMNTIKKIAERITEKVSDLCKGKKISVPQNKILESMELARMHYDPGVSTNSKQFRARNPYTEMINLIIDEYVKDISYKIGYGTEIRKFVNNRETQHLTRLNSESSSQMKLNDRRAEPDFVLRF